MAVVVLMLARVTVVMAVSVVALVFIFIIIATAMVALAQLVDVVGTHARLGHLIDDVAAGVVIVRTVHVSRIGRGTQHGATNRRMRAGITAQPANGSVHDKARDQRDQRLRCQQHRHSLHGNLLGEQERQHLIRSGEEYRHQRAQRHDATGVQRRRHGRKTALRHDAQQRTDNRTRGASALDGSVDAIARNVLERLEGKICH